jgi:hypothetical protein
MGVVLVDVLVTARLEVRGVIGWPVRGSAPCSCCPFLAGICSIVMLQLLSAVL